MYKGLWSKDRPLGRGLYVYSNGLVLSGDWLDGKYIEKEIIQKVAAGSDVNIYALIVGASKYDFFESLIHR